jgi:hypothetical protein
MHSPALKFFRINQNNEIAILISLYAIYKFGLILHKSVEANYRNEIYRDKSKKNNFIKLQILLIGICAAGIWASTNNYFLTDTVLSRPRNQMDPIRGENCPIIDGRGLCNYSGLGSKKVLIIGDSHAGSISRTLISLSRDFGSVDIFLKSGCAYLSPIYYMKNPRLDGNDLCHNYSIYLQNIVDKNEYDLIIATYRSSSLNNSHLSFQEYSKIKIESLLYLKNMHGTKLLFIGPTPEFPLNPDFFENNRMLIAGNEKSPKYFDIMSLAQIPFIENNFNHVFLSTYYPEVSYVDSIDLFCNLKTCFRYSNGWLYSDPDHLSDLGAEFMRSELSKSILTSFK